MRLTYKRVGRRHGICRAKAPKYLSPQARAWWKKAIGQSKEASSQLSILALDHKEIVGFLRFNLSRASVDDIGTWVEPQWRRQGVALRMWKEAIALCRKVWDEAFVAAVTTSRAGEGLIRALRKEHKTCQFHIVHNVA